MLTAEKGNPYARPSVSHRTRRAARSGLPNPMTTVDTALQRGGDLESEALLSVKQVAGRLNVSTATVHRLLEMQDISYVRIGIRTIRISESSLTGYLERCTVRHLR